MSSLDADIIQSTIGEMASFEELDVFAEIDSTNSYLMQQPRPRPGKFRVALTDNQTAGRGRHGRSWLSPPGTGLCLSMAYTFVSNPAELPALTLAIGLGVIDTLNGLGASGVKLKWPNDLVAMDGKLGGILTETQNRPAGNMTVVSGIGLNIDLAEPLDVGTESNWTESVVDLKSQVAHLPSRNVIASSLMTGMSQSFTDFDANGFSPFADRWRESDWLLGREIRINAAQNEITGIAAGVANDGALLVDTETEGTHRLTSGTVLLAGEQGSLG